MADALELMKKGALLQKREEFRELCRKIDRLVQNLQVNSFRLHDEDLDFKADLILQAAQELVKARDAALKLQKELEG